MKRILLDQGLPATAAIQLRNQGWDAIHVSEVGMQRSVDSSILDHAASESRAVITLDRDFPEILALTAATRPSVVLIRQQKLRAGDLVELLHSIWDEYEEEIDQGVVLKANAKGMRSRRLPLR
jgi:predicted nuclease of predicted toxin-antitoxin system